MDERATARPNYVIVVAVDYSEPSELAFEKALELAADKGDTELHVLHVCAGEGSADPMNGTGASPPSLRSAGLCLQNHVARTVSAFQTRTGCTPFKRLVTHVRIDEPGIEIAQLAADVVADLIVLGTHDRHGIPRLVLGSVAEGVARLAPCSVLVVRAKLAPSPTPAIEPPCPRCLATRRETNGDQFWCEQHRERHGQRHTYHQGDRSGVETNFPLVGPS
jgi:nucleotide-binding universal stress UspA family protein